MPRIEITTMSHGQRPDDAWLRIKPLLFISGSIAIAFCSVVAAASLQAGI